MAGALELVAEPKSVREARTWIVAQLDTIGRDDLADAARLGVSELVTNAILHADPPITVRLGGTPNHPRVEVHDQSSVPPSIRDMTTGARLMATVGRGLSLVARYSSAWGAEVSDRGKVVWFEPAADSDDEAEDGPGAGELHLTGDVFEAEAGDPWGSEGERVTVRFVGLPVAVFVDYRIWYDELRRELRLLALNHADDYPLATELTEMSRASEFERRRSWGGDLLETVMTTTRERLDIEVQAPASAPATMTHLAALLTEIDQFCRDHRLLTAAPTPQQLALRSWYLGEFGRQAAGKPPAPWPGGYTVVESGE